MEKNLTSQIIGIPFHTVMYQPLAMSKRFVIPCVIANVDQYAIDQTLTPVSLTDADTRNLHPPDLE